jgi:hypothetical protein
MSKNSEQYRLRAEEAEEWAESSTDSEERDKFTEIARQYRELAARVEKRSGSGLTMEMNLPPNDTLKESEH